MKNSIFLSYDISPESLLESHETHVRFRDRNRKRTSPLILLLFGFCFGLGLVCLTVSDLLHIASDLGLPITDWPLKNLIQVEGKNSNIPGRLGQPRLPGVSRLDATRDARHAALATWAYKAGLLVKHVGILLVLSLIWLLIYVQRPRNYFVRSAVRNTFRKLYPEGGATTCRWWIDEGSIDVESPMQRTSTTWDAFSEVAETSKGF